MMWFQRAIVAGLPAVTDVFAQVPRYGIPHLLWIYRLHMDRSSSSSLMVNGASCGYSPLIVVVKVNKLRFAVFEFCDDKARSGVPSHRDVRHRSPCVTYLSADTLILSPMIAETKMSYVERF